MNTDHQIKNAAVINSAVEQIRSLLETHYKAITKAAEESFVDDENQAEPVAKVTCSVKWDALSLAPKVGVKIGWAVSFKDESEAEIDPLQSKLGLVEDAQ